MTAEVKDPLVYEEAYFERKEWDNIPMVIPRCIFNLSKHLEALTGHCKTLETLESTAELRKAMLFEIKNTMRTSTSNQEQLMRDVKDIKAQISSIEGAI